MEHLRNATGDEWYRDKRRKVEAYFIEANLVADSDKSYTSPSDKYRLIVQTFRTRTDAWNYTRGRVFARDRLIAEVLRNYSLFHFGWAEGHANGHDYLLCGEDYQGQTVIELDTGKHVDFIPHAAQNGSGFCCAAYYASPDSRLMVIDGCYWACPYELVFCHFGDPMTLPWQQVDRVELSGEPRGWTEEGFVYETSEDIRVTDLKPYDELSDTEQDELWKRWKQIGGRRIRRHLRRSDGSRVLLDERVVPAAAEPER